MQRVRFKIAECTVYEHSVLMPNGFSERAARKKARETWESKKKPCNDSEIGRMVIHSEDQFVLQGVSTVHSPLPKKAR